MLAFFPLRLRLSINKPKVISDEDSVVVAGRSEEQPPIATTDLLS